MLKLLRLWSHLSRKWSYVRLSSLKESAPWSWENTFPRHFFLSQIFVEKWIESISFIIRMRNIEIFHTFRCCQWFVFYFSLMSDRQRRKCIGWNIRKRVHFLPAITLVMPSLCHREDSPYSPVGWTEIFENETQTKNDQINLHVLRSTILRRLKPQCSSHPQAYNWYYDWRISRIP